MAHVVWFFVARPVMAVVIAILIILIGASIIPGLPIAQYPNIVPPEILVQATYPGADALTVEGAVAAPIEQQTNGVDNMLYLKSTNATTVSQVDPIRVVVSLAEREYIALASRLAEFERIEAQVGFIPPRPC